VRASAARIDKLIARLAEPEVLVAEAPVSPLAILRSLAAARPEHVVMQEEGAAGGAVRMPRERLEAALTHLLNNAVDASAVGEKVRLRIRQDETRVIIDIVDRGSGMTPEFIRDELFRPLATAKPGGSGIGAWQARELLREAGGELTVLSRPGIGTTMRILLPLHAAAAGTRLAGGGTP
jgi:signal transduction histidine kinase